MTKGFYQTHISPRIGLPSERLYRRLVYAVVAVLFGTLVLSTWLEARRDGEEVMTRQTERMARVIMSQAQHEARIWFLQENTTGLESLAGHLLSQDGILEVTIQDERGQSLVRAGHDQGVADYLGSLPTDLWAVPMVEPVMDREGPGAELLGFVRITFDYDRILTESRPYHRQFFAQQGYLLFMAFLAGFLVAFSLIRRRHPSQWADTPIPQQATVSPEPNVSQAERNSAAGGGVRPQPRSKAQRGELNPGLGQGAGRTPSSRAGLNQNRPPASSRPNRVGLNEKSGSDRRNS